jgi:hypothetical protein
MRPSVIVTLYVTGVVVLLAFMKLLCHFTLAETFQDQLDESKQNISSLLRCLALYSQWMLLVVSLNIDWPAPISYPVQMLGWLWAPSNPETLGIDCLLSSSSGLPIAVQRVVFYLSVPIVMLALLLMLEVILMKVKRTRATAAASMKDRLGSSAMVVVFFFLPGVFRTVFGLFACVPLDRPVAAPYTAAAVGSFWVYDVSAVCFEGG